jgi:hypothetical protein
VNTAHGGQANGMKFGYELLFGAGVGVTLLYLIFGWPPALQPVVHSVISFLMHP